jgi:hypothetical protein
LKLSLRLRLRGEFVGRRWLRIFVVLIVAILWRRLWVSRAITLFGGTFNRLLLL